MKRLIISISAGIVIALVLVQLYCYFLHPEINFYRNAVAISTSWEEQIRHNGHSCFILGGGSEVRSSLSPKMMHHEAGIHAVNVATSAPAGLQTNAAIALHHVRPGDTLMLSIVSAQDSAVAASETGIKLSTRLCGTSVFTRGGITPSVKNVMSLFNSDAGSAFMLVTRKLTRGYGYAYEKLSTVHPDGWMEVHRNRPSKLSPLTVKPTLPILGTECIRTLKHAQSVCKKTGAEFVVMLPPEYADGAICIQRLLEAYHITKLGIPVLRDNRLGRITDPGKLADTHLHLNAEGTAENSRIIAHLLVSKNYWTESELKEKLTALGLKEDLL